LRGGDRGGGCGAGRSGACPALQRGGKGRNTRHQGHDLSRHSCCSPGGGDGNSLGILGSDIAARRTDWRRADNPFAAANEGGDPILLLPAIAPEIALFHSPAADRDGNVWIGRRRELVTMAHAARKTFVTVEKIIEDGLLASEASAAGTLPGLYVTAIAEAPRGAWPLGLGDNYEADGKHLLAYAEAARSEDGFRGYLEEYVLPHAF
jgi:glutaconate CoA-transferase subunit A